MADFTWKAARRKYGVVICNWKNASVKGSLSVRIGECVHILEEYCVGSGSGRKESSVSIIIAPVEFLATWYRGYSFKKRKIKGIFPAEFVHLRDCKVTDPGPYETVTPVEDPIIKEASFVLQEWHLIWKRMFVEHYTLFLTISNVMRDLMIFRKHLVSNTLTNEQALDVKQQIISRIDWGNGKLGLDLVPRRDGKQVDSEHCSVIELYRLHCFSVKNSKGTWPRKHTVSHRSRNSKENKVQIMTHLLLNFKSFACKVQDESETCFALYDNATNNFISEKFLVRCTGNGLPVNMEKLHNCRGLFSDLNEDDLKRDLYLVAQIFRCGRMLSDGGSKKIPLFKYRRPWGVAVLRLVDLFRISPEEELEFHIKVHSAENESSFHQLHENVIRQQTKNVGRGVSTDNSVAVSLKLLHGDLSAVKGDNPIMFSKGIAIAQRIGFSDSITPGEVRNDIYLTLVNGEMERGSKKAQKNIEVQVTVYDNEGKQIHECVSGGNGEDATSSYFSYIYYHNNSPKWNDTIRLSIPIEKFTGAHILFQLCHCSTKDKTEKKMYGFCYLSLTDKDSTTQADGNHVLAVYKCDSGSKVKNYTKLPSLKDDFSDPKVMSQLSFPHSAKEYLTVSTFLCSTKFTQQADLLGILQWTSRQDCVSHSLHNLISLRGQEVVKYLQDILDALFSMFGANSGERFKYSTDVFHALVHIFNLLQDSKFEKFSYILEAYIEENFSFPLVYRDLLLCVHEKTEQAVSCADFDKDYTVINVFQVLEPVFKCVAKSCLLFKSTYGNKMENFKQLLSSVFVSFGRIMASTEPILRDSQVKLLTQLSSIFSSLTQLIRKKELSELLQALYGKMPKEVNPVLMQAKMKLAQDIINSELFTEQESRYLVIPLCLSLMKRSFIQKIALPSAADTLGDILDRFTVMKVKDKELQDVMRVMFDPLVQTLMVLDELQREEAGGMMISCLLELLRAMEELHYNSLLSGYPKGRPLKEFLFRVLFVFRDLIRRDIFPPDWTVMRMVTNHVILTAIQYVAQSLTENFLTGSAFDSQLWSNYFDLAVSFVTQPSLQLERFSEAKKNKIRDKYQDMRVLIGLQIQTLWNGLGNHKSRFIPSMIGPFLEVTMVPDTDVRKATIPIFFDMMLCEQGLKGNFNSVESELIEKLDILITDNSGDLEYKSLFNQILLDKVHTEPVLKDDGRRFVISVTNLLEKLLDYRQVIDGEDNRDKRMHCTFNILNFYKENINREEMYMRYINKLFHLHHDANNFVEAGLTLQLYAQLLRWSDDVLPENLGYSNQKEWERKEELYLTVVDCFDKGKAWEYGIPLCKELAEFYERKVFNYKKLSEVLQREAAFFNNILEGQALRQDPTYYRVAYYGMSFPPFVRNKEFVYRGDECLKLSDIMSHLTLEFPSVTILTSNSPPDDSILEGEAQYIQICSVKPVPSERSEFRGQDVPFEITNFYNVNEVDTFQFDRPYHREERDKNNEFKTLCLERRILKTSYKLPGILRWYEVVQSEVTQIAPIMVAMENMKNVNQELDYLICRSKSNTDMYFKTLMMKLQGVISAAVSGGIPKYREAFFCDEFALKHPDEVGHLMELKTLLLDQVNLMERGLHVWGDLSTDDLRPLYKTQVETFRKLKQDVTETGSPRPRDRSLSMPPRPNTPGSGSVHSSGSNRSSITSGETVSQDGDNVYADLEDPNIPPPPPEKRRSGSRLANIGALLGGQQAPPIPTRPVSAMVSGSALQQLTDRLQLSKGVTGSDPALNQTPPPKPLTASMSSYSLGSGSSPSPGSKTPEAGLRRFVSTPETASADPAVPPPLPQRKGSESNLLSTRPPPPPPRQSEMRFLSYNVPAPSSPASVEEKPAIPSRNRNGSVDATKDTAGSEDKKSVSEVSAPPLPPRIPPRPPVPPLPKTSSSVKHPVKDDLTSPPPVPRRTSLYTRSGSGPSENTKL